MPAVSIIMPVFNAATTLDECLRSIKVQTFTDFETIVINDGSSDHSTKIIQQYQQNDSRIKLLQPGRQGLVSALNTGILHSTSPLLARMDADDIMHPERLKLQVDYLSKNAETGLIASQAQLFPEIDIKQGYQEYMNWQNACLTHKDITTQIYIESPFAHPSVMFRKSVLDISGMYKEGNFPEDYDLWLRMLHAGIKMEKLDQYLLKWRDSTSRTSRVDSKYSRQAFDQLRAKYLAMENRIPRNRTLVYWGAGRKTRIRAQLLINQGFAVSGWIDVDPDKIGNVINGAPVHAPEWLQQKEKPYVLNYVNNYGAREEIEKCLREYGYRPEHDYLMIG